MRCLPKARSERGTPVRMEWAWICLIFRRDFHIWRRAMQHLRVGGFGAGEGGGEVVEEAVGCFLARNGGSTWARVEGEESSKLEAGLGCIWPSK